MTSFSYPDPIVITVTPVTPASVTVNEIVVGAINSPSIAYHYIKNTPSASWVIAHNLGFYPNVTAVDSAGTIVEGEITYTNINNLTLTFSAAFSGHAYLS